MLGKNLNYLKLFLLTILITLFAACAGETETVTIVEEKVVEVVKEVPVEK